MDALRCRVPSPPAVSAYPTAHVSMAVERIANGLAGHGKLVTIW